MYNHELQSYTKNFCGKLTCRESCRTIAYVRAGRADRKKLFLPEQIKQKEFFG